MQLKLETYHIIKVVIGFILMFVSIILAYRFYNEIREFKGIYGKELTFNLAVKLIYNGRTFINPTILAIAILGLFIKKPIGWVFTNNIFSYVLTIAILMIMPTEDMKWYYYSFGLIPVAFIILMHHSKILDFHKIKRINLLTYNLTVLVSGMTFAFLWGYYKIHPGMNYIDIIYNK